MPHFSISGTVVLLDYLEQLDPSAFDTKGTTDGRVVEVSKTIPAVHILVDNKSIYYAIPKSITLPAIGNWVEAQVCEISNNDFPTAFAGWVVRIIS